MGLDERPGRSTPPNGSWTPTRPCAWRSRTTSSTTSTQRLGLGREHRVRDHAADPPIKRWARLMLGHPCLQRVSSARCSSGRRCARSWDDEIPQCDTRFTRSIKTSWSSSRRSQGRPAKDTIVFLPWRGELNTHLGGGGGGGRQLLLPNLSHYWSYMVSSAGTSPTALRVHSRRVLENEPRRVVLRPMLGFC